MCQFGKMGERKVLQIRGLCLGGEVESCFSKNEAKPLFVVGLLSLICSC
jgi:hypothetical protein